MPILKELVGRLEDMVIGPDGRETVRFNRIFVGMSHVKEGQVSQYTLKDFTLRLVVDPAFDDHDRNLIQQRFSERLGDVELTFDYVGEIPRTRMGKFRAVVSHVQRRSGSSQTRLAGTPPGP